MHIDRNTSGDITLSQEAYYKWMLNHFNMNNYSPKSTPLPTRLVLLAKNCPKTQEEINKMKNIPYQEVLRSLM